MKAIEPITQNNSLVDKSKKTHGDDSPNIEPKTTAQDGNPIQQPITADNLSKLLTTHDRNRAYNSKQQSFR